MPKARHQRKQTTRAKAATKTSFDQACDDSKMISKTQSQEEAKLNQQVDQKPHQKD